MSKFSENVKELRTQKRMTQAELASLVGIAEKDVERIECNLYSRLTPELVNKIAAVLNTNALSLIEMSGGGIRPMLNDYIDVENGFARSYKFKRLSKDQQTEIEDLIDCYYFGL